MPRGKPNSGILGGRCKVCTHAARMQIDYALAAGLGRRRIAEKFGVSADAIQRHSHNHLAPELRAAMTLKLIQREGDVRAVLLDEGVGTIEALKAVRGPLFGRFLAAVDIGDDRSAVALAARLHESLQLSARLTGQLVPHANVNVTTLVISQDYIALRSSLLAALRPFPEAARAVAEVFRRTGEHAAAEMQRNAPRMIEAKAVEVSDAA
jgi:hypothetical protein